MIKLPRGTQDYFRESYDKLEFLKREIAKLFEKYHGEFVETPVFELTRVLMNKYGEEEKLIFNIESGQTDESDYDDADNSKNGAQKESVSLRYDHTVPLVRFCLLNGITKLRRCCIGKVYRRETVTRTQVRLREFYQADFDYVGPFDELVPEIEIMCMIQELFRTIGITNYQILYNYRQNLDFYIKNALIDPAKFSTVCSSIDKLDKKTPDFVREELLLKGLTDKQIDDLYSCLFSDTPTMEESVKVLDEKFKKYIDSIKILEQSKIVFTPTLARGSDYYTGIIFEVKFTDSDFTSSVAGGGRYDKLITSYDKSLKECPVIGFSFGIDRLLPFIKMPPKAETVPKIWISTIGKIDDPVKIKLDLVGKMIEKGYGVFYNLADRKFTKEIADANDNGCSFVIIVGKHEWDENKVVIKNMVTRKQETIEFDKIDEYFNSL